MPGAADLSRDLARHAEAFCRFYFPNGRKVGNYWQMGDVTGVPGRSLGIRLRESGGREAGKWADRASGEYGDLLDLLEIRIGATSFRELRSEAMSFLGRPEAHHANNGSSGEHGQSSDHAEKGRKLFSYGHAFNGTAAERYLRARGINRFGPALRYHSRVYLRDGDGSLLQLPAMLAAITDNDGNVTGCARTFLDTKLDRVAAIEEPKRVLGQLYGNAIRFSTRAGGEDLIAGEGLENVLSIGSALPLLDLASCLTAQHLALFNPPPWCKRLWIARDNDEAGEKAASDLRARAEPMGIAVFDLVPERNDFNDDLRECGLQKLRSKVEAQMRAAMSGSLPWKNRP